MNDASPGGIAPAAMHLQRFAVTYAYPVFFTEGLFDPANPVLVEAVSRLEPGRRHSCLVLIDAGVLEQRPGLARDVAAYAERHAHQLELAAPPLTLQGGEAVKNDPAVITRLHRLMLDHRMDRHAFVIAIGGGALLDAVGFAAATAHRGVRLIRVPTTVLAQNDSGVGVKNAVNLFGVKNFCGTFAPPFAVLNDADFIALLPPRERIAGMAEAVKVALIRDAAFFSWLEAQADALAEGARPAVAHMIRRCAELHMRQIAEGGDPFEAGSARPLDFGHWAAHRLEALTTHALSHGQAVAIGIALDARYSVLSGVLAQGEELRVASLLERLGFRLWHPALLQRDPAAGERLAVLQGLSEFREHLGGELTITLLAAIGRGIEVHAMDEAAVKAAIAWLEARETSR